MKKTNKKQEVPLVMTGPGGVYKRPMSSGSMSLVLPLTLAAVLIVFGLMLKGCA